MNRRRLLAVVFVLALGVASVTARSIQVAVVEHAEWRELALKQHQHVIEVPGPRGSIRTSDGYVLATSVGRMAIQVDTKRLEFPEIFVQAAAPLLETTKEKLKKRIERGPRSVWLAQRVTRPVAEEVRSLAPQAVVLVPDSARIYPQATLAAPVVGFTGREELLTVGRSGFEHSLNNYLAGEPEQYLSVNDAIQRRVRLQRLHRGRAGYDLELTLNGRLQARAESALQKAITKHSARAGSAVVADAQSGHILAIVSLPSFDPSDPGASPVENWRLRAVQDAMEPGSTVKPMVAAAALAEGVVRPGEKFDCLNKGTRVAGHWVRDHASPGLYTLDEVVVYSANVGIIQAAARVPDDHLWRAFSAFGFGRKTGLQFPAEARGLLPETSTWSRMSSSGFALGQEMTVSPLQMTMAYAAIANGGWLPQPRLVMPREAQNVAAYSEPKVRVLDEALAERIRVMLEGVVRDGTGEYARVAGFRTAGKTGTAQRAVNGTFDDQHHIAWFAGFFPMPDPSIVIVVAIEDPAETDFWASTVAAPVFAEIAEASACLFDLAPTEKIEPPEPLLASNKLDQEEDDA